jgi:hypothetical protein
MFIIISNTINHSAVFVPGVSAEAAVLACEMHTGEVAPL